MKTYGGKNIANVFVVGDRLYCIYSLFYEFFIREDSYYMFQTHGQLHA